MEKGKKKTYYITVLNVVSAIAVVFIHANGYFWRRYEDGLNWKTSNFMETFCYFAVPCFFMISGATLMDYGDRYTLKEYFIKRIKKTVIPFIIWSVIGFLYYGFVLKSFKPEEYYSVKAFFNGIMNTDFVSIYWFFPKLYLVYLSIPLFAGVEKAKRKEIFSYLAIAGFILNAAIPFVTSVFKLDLYNGITIITVSDYLIYPVIGYLIANYEIPKKGRLAIYLASITGFLIQFVGTDIISSEAGETLRTLKGYNNAIGIMYSVGIFVWFRYNIKSDGSGKAGKLFTTVSGYTFGLYLFHKFLLDTVKNMTSIDYTSFLFRLGVPVAVIIVCIVVIFLVQRIPVINKLLFP